MDPVTGSWNNRFKSTISPRHRKAKTLPPSRQYSLASTASAPYERFPPSKLPYTSNVYAPLSRDAEPLPDQVPPAETRLFTPEVLSGTKRISRSKSKRRTNSSILGNDFLWQDEESAIYQDPDSLSHMHVEPGCRARMYLPDDFPHMHAMPRYMGLPYLEDCEPPYHDASSRPKNVPEYDVGYLVFERPDQSKDAESTSGDGFYDEPDPNYDQIYPRQKVLRK